MAPPDRSDKFTYTHPNQIKINPRKDRSKTFDDLRAFVEEHDLDPGKVYDLVSTNADALRRSK